jgi:perosamine synthetase
MMSLHGLNRDAWLRFTAQGSWYYEIVAPGFKYNLTDIGAALGIEQLKRAEELRQARERIAEFYLAALADVSEIILPARAAPGDLHSWHLFVIRLELERLQIDRARFIEELKARGIGTSVHYIPLHLHPYYRETYGYQPDDLPVASQIAQQVISLPIYPNMTEADAQRVAHAVAEIARCHRA